MPPTAASLPPGYFAYPALSRDDKAYLVKKACESARILVKCTRDPNGPIRWRETGSHKRVYLYKGEPRDPAAQLDDIAFMCGITNVRATIEEVAAFFDISTPDKMRAFVATQDDLLDGVLLARLVQPDETNDFLHQITVKWTAAKMSSSLIKPRDFVTLECQDTFTDKTGRRGWVRSYHSVRFPSCPELTDGLGFVRGSIYHSGHVFVESETPGVLKCITSLQVNLKGNLGRLDSISEGFVKRRIGAVAELTKQLAERRLSQQPFLGDLDLEPTSDHESCRFCTSGFNMFSRKIQCRKCGQVVCQACSQSWTIHTAEHGPRRVHVCAPCARRTGQSQDEEDPIVLSTRSHRSMTDTNATAFHTPRPISNHRMRGDRSRSHRSTTVPTLAPVSSRGNPRQLLREEESTSQRSHRSATVPDRTLSASRTHQRQLVREKKSTPTHRQFHTAPCDLSAVPSSTTPTESRTRPREDDDRTNRTMRRDLLKLSDLEVQPTTVIIGGADLPEYSWNSNLAEQGSSESIDRLVANAAKREDPAASAVTLYRRIVELTSLKEKLDPRANESSRQRLADELSSLYEQLQKVMQLYEME